MKRQEYIELVDDWNSFLLKEERKIILENYLINEGFDKKTLKMFTIGALAMIGANFINIDSARADDTLTASEKIIDKQTMQEMDESARAIIVLRGQQGYKLSGASESETRDLLMQPLSKAFGKENAELYLDDHYFVVGSADPEDMMQHAIEKAKKEGVEEIDKTFIQSVSSETSSFTGFEEIESLIQGSSEKFNKAFEKHKNWSKKSLLIGNKKLKQKTLDLMVEYLELTSKNLRAAGFNSNNIKATALILLNADLEATQLVTTLKTLNSGTKSGARLNPRIGNILSKFSMIIDFEVASGKDLKEAIAKEIFSSQEGCDAFSALRTFTKMGFEFMEKVKSAIKSVKMKSAIKGKNKASHAKGNPQHADKLNF